VKIFTDSICAYGKTLILYFFFTFMVSRTPPKNILEKLRKEVNFGCPVDECGSPYLMYHHYDPPWREKQHHDPEGMIALCTTHAFQADGGRWTKEQLKVMKRNPYIKLGMVKDVYGYLRRDIVCDVGFIGYSVKNILEINGERVIGFVRDESGCDRLNLLIRNEEDEPILIMENNFWMVYSRDLFDLRCSAQGRELEVVSLDGVTNFSMRFDDYSQEDFIKYLSKNIDYENITYFLSRMGNPELIPVWKIRGKLKWGDSYIKIGDFFIEDLNKHNIKSASFVSQSRSALSFKKDGSIGFG